MKEAFTFDDVLIKQKFSDITSRKEVSLDVDLEHFPLLKLPVISANMDTITGDRMARAMVEADAIGCLHRFCTIEENMKMFYDTMGPYQGDMGCHENFPFVSIGIGEDELRRAEALLNCGANVLVVDVAHGAQLSVVNQVKNLRNSFGRDCSIVVGNFSNRECVLEFLDRTGDQVDAIKVGVGPGSACTTRIKTGVGYPQLSAIMDIAECLNRTKIATIADGGMRTPGDVAKALGAGAHFVMLGGMLAGTDETPGDVYYNTSRNGEFLELRTEENREAMDNPGNWFSGKPKIVKKYRGSASKESYELQGKDASWRGAEGESFTVPYKGPVSKVLQDIENGVRSAMTYTGSRTIEQFHQRCEFVKITPSTVVENGAHGRK